MLLKCERDEDDDDEKKYKMRESKTSETNFLTRQQLNIIENIAFSNIIELSMSIHELYE